MPTRPASDSTTVFAERSVVSCTGPVLVRTTSREASMPVPRTSPDSVFTSVRSPAAWAMVIGAEPLVSVAVPFTSVTRTLPSVRATASDPRRLSTVTSAVLAETRTVPFTRATDARPTARAR